MKKLNLFFLVSLISIINLYAQSEFSILRLDQSPYTISTDPQVSAIIVECQDIEAQLDVQASNAILTLRDTVMKNKTCIYYFETKLTPDYTWEQDVEFRISGYKTLVEKVSFSSGKLAQPFRIFDPNKAVTGYFYNRNNAKKYFEMGDYEQAVLELKIAEKATNVDKNDLQIQYQRIDSIQGLYAAAQDSIDQKKYYAAVQIYKQILKLNKTDEKAGNLLNEMQTKFEDQTNALFRDAEGLLTQHKYTDAADNFQKYIDFHGDNKALATSRLNEIKRQEQNKREMPHVFYYQFDGRAPINFGYGHFKDRGAGWFMNFSMNKEVFKLLSDEWIPKNSKGEQIETHSNVADSVKIGYLGQIDNVPEINLALVGLSIPLVSPHPEKENQYFRVGKLVVPKFPALYLNIVPLSASLAFGYDETKWYLKSEDGKEVVSEGTKDAIVDYKTKALISYAPQVGLTLKWGRLALFYTYEYRYLVNNRTMYKDAIRNSRSMFGIGFAW